MTFGPHLARVILAICSSVVLTSTVVGPLAYRAHTARIDSEIIARLGPAVVRPRVSTTTVPEPTPTSRPAPFVGTPMDPPGDVPGHTPTTTWPAPVITDPAQVLDTSVTRGNPTTPNEAEPSPTSVPG